jgi:hypothetical protein
LGQQRFQVFKEEQWYDISFSELKKGDKFRVFNPDGQLVTDENGNTEFIASGVVRVNDTGELTVETVITRD